MNSHQYRPKAGATRRDTVEQLLNEVPGADPAEVDALLALFATVAGPVRPGELAGEEAAAAAFRAALPQPVLAPRRAPKVRTRAALLTIKTAVAALALTSMGGVALAATTGVLPTPLTSHPADPAAGDSAGKSSAGDIRGGATEVTGGASYAVAVREAAKKAAAEDRADDIAGRAHASSYAGLCKAFAAGAWDHGKAAGSPGFARLAAAAPQGNVAEFCTALGREPAADEDTKLSDAPPVNRKSPAPENAADKSKTGPEHRDADAGKGPVDKGRQADSDDAGDAGDATKVGGPAAGHAAVGNERGEAGGGQAGDGKRGKAGTDTDTDTARPEPGVDNDL